MSSSLSENEIRTLSEEKKRVLRELEEYILDHNKEVQFVGTSLNLETNVVTITIGGQHPRRMAITAPTWVQRLQSSLPDIEWKLNIVRGRTRSVE